MTAPSGEARPLRLGTRKSPMAMVQSQQVARLIRDLEIDILVDLAGLTKYGRPNIAARRTMCLNVAGRVIGRLFR